MQSGHCDDMADPSDLESGRNLVAHFCAITKEQGLGEKRSVLRKDPVDRQDQSPADLRYQKT